MSELAAHEVRQIFDAMDLSTVVGLRDRALIGLMVFSFARVSATVAMQIRDYYHQGKRSYFRLHEKADIQKQVLNVRFVPIADIQLRQKNQDWPGVNGVSAR